MIQEGDGTQLSVYYVSQAFQGAEAKYPRIERIAFALIVASRKLRPYFQANPIFVMTSQPIKKSMNKLEATGRMVQWVIELSEFDIKYHPRTAINAQALAKIFAEFIVPDKDGALDEAQRWTIQADVNLKEFDQVEFIQVPRSQNMEADEIAKLASSEA